MADDFAGMADEEIVMMLIDGFWLQPVTVLSSGSRSETSSRPQTISYTHSDIRGGMATTSLFKKEFTSGQDSD